MDRQNSSKNSERDSPTRPAADRFNPALARNVDAVVQQRKDDAKAANLEERVAAAVGKFAGSMLFVYIHLVFFGAWIAINTGLVGIIEPWDPSLVVLAMIASVEAIFLSTFVLINQNRMAAEDDARADLDLQINLLNEHETTKLITMVEAITKHLNVQSEADQELGELKQDVAPETVLQQIRQKGDDPASE